MKAITIFSFVLIVLLAFSACNPDFIDIDVEEPMVPAPVDDCPPLSVLPPVTITGVGTMGCVINGETWSPYAPPPTFFPSPFDFPPIYISHSANTRILSVLFSRKVSDSCEIFPLRSIDFRVLYDNNDEIIYSNFHGGLYGIEYLIDSTKSHGITIRRFDSQNRILSAEFFGTLVHHTRTDTIRIDSGRLDIPF